MKATVVPRGEAWVIEIRGTAPGCGHVVHESGPIPLDTKSAVTRMEIEWCVRNSTVSYAHLYDAVRVAQRHGRLKAV